MHTSDKQPPKKLFTSQSRIVMTIVITKASIPSVSKTVGSHTGTASAVR